MQRDAERSEQAPASALPAPRGRAMKCTICGKPALPGTALCAPCKAALKRARYVTVQEDPRPSVRVMRRKARRDPAAEFARKASEDAQRRKAAELAASPLAQGARLTGRHLLLGGIVVAVLAGAAYVAQHASPSGTRDTPVDTAAAPPGDLLAPSAATPSAQPSVREGIPPAGTSAKGGRDGSGRTGDLLFPVAPSVKSPAPGAMAKRSAPLFAPPQPPTEALEMVAVPQEPPRSVPLQVAARPAPDRWQTMSDALGRCDREGAINGLICGQRVRIQYCDGYWGQVPQCPGAVSNLDHGP
jgi:hypothetical protein